MNIKGLQKFTKSEAKINKMLSLEQITLEDLKQLSESEKSRFSEIVKIEKPNTVNN